VSDLPKTLTDMYDVVYIDAQGDETPVAQHLDDRKDAAEVARQAAAERGAGRMVLPGSSKLPNCVCVIPVHSEPGVPGDDGRRAPRAA
jgi:hypothetical protein